MNPTHLIEGVPESPAEALASWRQCRVRIHDEFEKATSAERRAALLALNYSIMNMVEKVIDPKELENFREIRGHSYSLLIVKECMVGDRVCAQTAGVVTRREIAAGRMAPTHVLLKMENMQKLAAEVTRARLATQKFSPKPPGLMGRAMSWLLE